jgi:hypothetical protein
MNTLDAEVMFEALSAYQVAVMAFTTPAEVVSENDQRSATLTSKDSYVWAGAVAYVLVRRPELQDEHLLGFLRAAVARAGPIYASRVVGHTLGAFEYHTNAFDVVRAFLQEAGLDRAAFEDACDLTQDAIRSLEWLGIIEDPIRKKIAGILLAAYAFAGPVNFTGTGPNDFTYSTITWQASAKKDEITAETRFTFNLKVHRIAKVIKDEVVESLGKVIEEAAAIDTSEEGMSTEELQTLLRDLGYYDGQIDGKPWQKTYLALKRFQQDRDLKVTGHPDADTVLALRASRPRK